MSADRWFWAQKAQQLKFTQLESARAQAETWRTGLTGITALLGVALVVKGRDDVTALAWRYQLAVLALFALALGALVLAALTAVRAASGEPGDACLLTGEDLQAWTTQEVRRVHRAVAAARRLTVGGLCAVAVGVSVAWLAPAEREQGPLVRVDSPAGQVCGRLMQLGDGLLRVGEAGSFHVIPLTSVIRVDVVETC